MFAEAGTELLERSWLPFLVGSGIAFFTAIGAGLGSVAYATCTVAMWTAVFGGPVAALPTIACLAPAAIGLLATSTAAGLYTYGSSKGWVFEDAPTRTGDGRRRDLNGNITYPKLYNNALGLAHNFDADLTRSLNLTHGAMLDHHNTTLIHVSWMELIPDKNHTGGPFDGLDMTNGRVTSLNDNGMIRTALGHTTKLGSILDAFNDFKSNTSSPLTKRQSSETVDWMTYNSYGENMNEAAGVQWGLDYDVAESADPFLVTSVDGWAESFDYYAPTFCLGASPPGDGQGQDSIIVGQIYTNSFGNVDAFCDSG